MAYSPSVPLTRWSSNRREVIGVLAEAHRTIGDVAGPGRPKDVSKPLAHAYLTGMVSEFQGFCRDLHDLVVERIVTNATSTITYVPLLTEGFTKGRGIDRGNATLSTIKNDFARVGLSPLDLSVHDSQWSSGDSVEFPKVFELRNALAHGNQKDLDDLRRRDIKDTVTWARDRLPVLNRVAKALDRAVWDHLSVVIGTDPWT
ncbi:hypothetical protein GCM10027062_15800 [Nocardioides hungaricus]